MPPLPKSATAITPAVVAVGVGLVAYPALWLVDRYIVDVYGDQDPSLLPALAAIAWPVCLVVTAVWLVMLGLVRVFGPGRPSRPTEYRPTSEAYRTPPISSIGYEMRRGIGRYAPRNRPGGR